MTLLSRFTRQDPPSPAGASTQARAGHSVDVPASLADETSSVDADGDAQALVASTASSGGDAALAALAVNGATTKIRQLAAEAIVDPEQIKELLKDVRGKDKNVYKIIRQKCDAMLAEEKTAADRQAAIESLSVALEKHTHQPFDNLYTPTLDHLCAQWRLVAEYALAESHARVEQAIDRCRAVVTKHLQDVASQAARANAIASAEADRQTVIAELRGVLTSLYESPEAIDIEAMLATCAERWIDIASYKSPSKSDVARFDALRHAIGTLLASIRQSGSISQQASVFNGAPADSDLAAQAKRLKSALACAQLLDDAQPVAVTQALELLRSWESARTDQEAARAKSIKQLSGLIRAATGALANGQSRQAAGMRRAIEDKLSHIQKLPDQLAKQLEHLDEKLKVLQDWRNYAVAPKRIELIERMEALIDVGEDPNALAEKIKRLQEEWKLISKGNTDNTDAEWQRFHEAAQKAFEPCRAHFAAQAKLREDNLHRRKALLDRIVNFAAAQNWEEPNWREVARAIRESRQQWRSHQPVERGPNKPLQEQFDTVTSDLQTRLDAESERNATAKRRLIARAQGLMSLDDARKAIDEVKRLQAAWKDVGLVHHEEDQKLWAEFRQQCDAVFAKRQQQHSEFVGALDANKSQATELCEEAERLSALSGAELVEALKKVPALRASFDALGELPKASARDIQRRFSKALDRYEQSIAKHRAQEKAQAWTRVLDIGDKIRLYRLAVAESASSEQCDALQQDAQSFIDSIEHWPKGVQQAVKSELAKSASPDLAANELALRTLCIRAEILTDTGTPEEDQQLRREHQLRRLTQRMGQGAGAPDDMNALTLEWIAVGPTPAPVYEALLARFNRCRLK